MVKREPTGEWFATFGIETHDGVPSKSEEPEQCVGIDVGFLKYVHDSDRLLVRGIALGEERERLEREQRKLSRKEHESVNYCKQ